MAEPESELMAGLRQALYNRDKDEVLKLLQVLASKGVKVTFKRNDQRLAARMVMTLPPATAQLISRPGTETLAPRSSYYGSPS